MTWTLVGIDCATQEERTGLAHGELDEEGHLRVRRVTLGTAGESAPATVAQWIDGAERFVVALDAPLGWPRALGGALVRHRAGQRMAAEPNALFRRATDSFVHGQLRKMPLEVGADRIARTARAALGLLESIRKRSGRELPLSWAQGEESGAIEVYPAATLLTRGLKPTGYKTNTHAGRRAREAVVERFAPEVDLRVTRDLLVENDDLLDAMLCVVAAADFARGICEPPEDSELALREGWIWFRGSGQRKLQL